MYPEPRGLDSSLLARVFSLCTTFQGDQFGVVAFMEIAASCIAFAQVADKTIRTIRGFIIDCRDARTDLSAVNRELLKTCSIRDDIRDIIKNCLDAAKDIDDVLVEHRGRFAAVSWAATGKQKVNSLKAVLEAHRRALNLAVDTVTLAMTKSIKNDTEDILEDTADIKADTADIKEDATKILQEIARLETLIRRNIPAQSSKMFLLNRYLYDLTSVAGSVCGDLSRPGTPESISERSSTLIATETASNHDVSREPDANKLKAEEYEASNRPSTPKPSAAPMSLPASKPSPVSTPLSVPTPPPVSPQHTGAENHQRPQPMAGKFSERAPGNHIKSLPVRPPSNQLIKQQSQTVQRVERTLPHPTPVPHPKKELEARPAQEPDQRFTLAGDAALVLLGQEKVFEFPSMERLLSFSQERGPVTNLTTDGSIFWARDKSSEKFDICKTLIFDWMTARHKDEKDGIPDCLSLNVSLPIDLNRGLCLQRQQMRAGVVGNLHLYRVRRVGTVLPGISVENVMLSKTPAEVAQCGWNFSDDGRHIVSFFNLQSNPVVETWNFKDDLATEGALWPKYQQSEKDSYSLKPHPHPNGKACNCYASSVAMAGNLVVVVSYVYKPQISPLLDYFVTGWNLGTGRVVFCHVLGTWELGDSFLVKLSRDAKILQISRKANVEEEAEWREFREFKSAYLHSTLEIDGPDLRLVQNYAIFDNDDVNALEKDIGRTFFLSMVEPAEEGRLSSWVFDCVFNLKRLDGKRPISFCQRFRQDSRVMKTD
ncbi:uncharacterized protein NECHADRAFT_88188 [Fusarium vanettenii 77-13-4]|uniref:Fungal N-terminal domain-containing protein n=1 Tax=Fusarium vanettenii (strain ATCC MYA-4622 / CBS 123669 / FGSC 9596 / NRRL 45880 / 77-13-4) TaxID=660122 RepID=C7ZDG1_FUSV7|nr:uncharacterized protein NECHADRAFT_88188 [Fusarium vanettenii 77-13-4]EEU37896.1 predicted protein [Fusarium vanettenii 77-13-4]